MTACDVDTPRNRLLQTSLSDRILETLAARLEFRATDRPQPAAPLRLLDRFDDFRLSDLGVERVINKAHQALLAAPSTAHRDYRWISEQPDTAAVKD